MKFALLGIDAEALSLVREIARSDLHQLRYFAPATDSAVAASLIKEARRLCPLAEELPEWEVLLGSGFADAVIVAGPQDAPLRFDQLRRLVQEAVPVIVTQPPAVTLLEAYELEMVRQESRGIVVPLLPWHWFRWSGWWASLVNVARNSQGADSAVGRLDQITWERFLVDRSRLSVLSHFARDVDFIRLMCGEITQVAALGGGPTGNVAARDFSALAVQMSGPNGILVRWSVQEPEDRSGVRITVAGTEGKNRLEVFDGIGGASWTAGHFAPGQSQPTPWNEEIEEPLSLADLVAEQVHLAAGDSPEKGRVAHPTWRDAIRSLELVEAVEKSLKKGRTISVSVEGRSETDAFKGTMASIGCALLMMGLLIVVASAVVLKIAHETGNHMLVSIFRWWPAGLVTLFGVFILMQLLRFIIPRPPRQD
ncbi:MAG: hypothetical protein K8T91_21205 [Planctomycetes bacterium]|nr:hypothetical protein [Planctomycetota bacterium]